jgi:hypothetical protein
MNHIRRRVDENRRHVARSTSIKGLMKIAYSSPLDIHRMVDENRLFAAFRREAYLMGCFFSNSSTGECTADVLGAGLRGAFEKAIILLDNGERPRDKCDIPETLS